MQTSPLLQVDGLHTYYGDSHVLQGITLDVQQGSVTAVLGRNGVGKTTLCRSLMGLTPARSGRALLGGTDITRLPPHRVFQRGVGLVPQGRHIFSSLTVHENLAICVRGVRLQPDSADRSVRLQPDQPQWTLENVFALFPRLDERRHHRGNELSGGEQQMLAIARALVANPRLLIMDEPTEGLAPVIISEVAKLIRRLRDEGTTVLLVEQNAAFAVTVSDYAYVMSQGRIVHASTPMALWEDEEIKTELLGIPRSAAVRIPKRG
jgi:branched-chain amino acid transport system ATP-binding protein